MALIHQNRKNIVIDMGSTKEGIASNILTTFLQKKAIKKIDLVILTHMHEDHINGLENVVEKIRVEKVAYARPKICNKDSDKKVKEILNRNNIPIIDVEEYDRLDIGNTSIDILSPPKEKYIEAKDEENSNSLILLVNLNRKTNWIKEVKSVENKTVGNYENEENNIKSNYLFMGDATKESDKSFIERLEKINDFKRKENIKQRLKNLNAIQIGHHGSKTSTSDELLNNINVLFAIISSKKEKFGHPADEVIEKLKRQSIEIKITEKNGAIKF
ncbi:MAG: MBL fold metallo-hydrolase [Clostridia bacterium]